MGTQAATRMGETQGESSFENSGPLTAQFEQLASQGVQLSEDEKKVLEAAYNNSSVLLGYRDIAENSRVSGALFQATMLLKKYNLIGNIIITPLGRDTHTLMEINHQTSATISDYREDDGSYHFQLTSAPESDTMDTNEL